MFDHIKQKQVKSGRATVQAVEKVVCKALEISSSD